MDRESVNSELIKRRRRDYRKRYPHTKDKGKREEEDVERRHIFGVGKT